ncbi:MAG: hypothetical protein M1818_006213 [Claussenomyces sp. TS43310]|nr:MAG: hypothetical protein M1818_006213 [Claussenomyces sp. TS43310]
MWLDRLSGHSTPNPSPPPSGPYRSLPSASRRPSHLAPQAAAKGPRFSPRSSSLSLVSNDSTTSLLGNGARKVNGSGLRQSATTANYPEPLEVLEKLLGAEPKVDSKNQKGRAESDDGEELDFGGLSLQEWAGSELAVSDAAHVYRAQTIEEYEKEKAKFEDLHRSIRACDDVLKSVETNLTNFQDDLGAVSAEIETLQARSTALNIRLENRKVVEKGLGPVVEEITLSPAVVRKIAEGAVDEAWVRALAEVEKRSKTLDLRSKDRNIRGIGDLQPLLEHLINKALERIRDFLVAQIKALRSPNINAQIIQQQHFLRYKDLFAFLWRHHKQLAEEISQAYMNTMRWYYLNQFTRYEKALEKVKIHMMDKHDLLGQDDGTRKSNLLSGSKVSGPPHDAFNLGRRIDLLKNSNQSALPSYLAEEDASTHYLEFPFRHFNVALIDNASAEYSFLTSFFGPSLSLAIISRHFNFIFEPTFSLGQALTRTLVSETVDSLGLLLCVRLTQHLAFELQRRKIPAVDGYINGTSMLLWPRFQVLMDQHGDSLRRAAAALGPARPPTGKADRDRQSAAPHFLAQRFGQFLHAILALSAEAADDEPVSTSLARLRADMDALLSRLAKGIGEPRKRERFLFNNYSLILTIVGDLDGKLAKEQREHFEALRRAFGDAL